MNVPFLKSNPKTFVVSPNAISSQESGDGPMPCASQVFLTTPKSGQDPRPANRSLRPECRKERTTNGTLPRTSQALSQRPSRPCSLESRLPVRRSSEALQAKVEARLQAKLNGLGSTTYSLAWKTHTTPARRRICRLRALAPRMSAKGVSSARSGWPTPRASEPSSAGQGFSKTLTQTVRESLTPDEGFVPARCMAGGPVPTGSQAEMANGGLLNPAHSRWLMGYPPEWDACAVMAMQSSRKPRQRSSKRC